MHTMRAKMMIRAVEKHSSGNETLHFCGVAKDGPYPSDGSDEDNSFARFSPSAELKLTVANPALIGNFAEGDKFYLDFTRIDWRGKLRPDRAVLPDTVEGAWLIEDAASPVSGPTYFSAGAQGPAFVEDSLAALRFSRKGDAEAFALMSSGSLDGVRVAFHEWG